MSVMVCASGAAGTRNLTDNSHSIEISCCKEGWRGLRVSNELGIVVRHDRGRNQISSTKINVSKIEEIDR